MQLAYFHTGQHLTLDSISYQVVRVLENHDVVLERASDCAMVKRTKMELLSSLADGALQFIGADPRPVNRTEADLKSYTDLQQKEVLRKRKYIELAVHVLGEKPKVKGLDEVIKKVASELKDGGPPSSITLYRWWVRWDRSGNDITALAAKVSRKRDRTYLKKLAPIFHEVVEEVIFNREKHSYQAAYDAFCVKLQEVNRKQLISHAVPSRATFYRMVKSIDPYLLMEAREGKRAAKKHFRATGQGVKATHILERVEIDHTPIDLIVVDEQTGIAQGRPSLTFVIDHFSRMPLGFSVGFEPPSELSVMRALRHSILPKSYIKTEFPELTKGWPAFGIPSVLVCDNGSEFHAHELRRMCLELNIELFFCPKQTPQYKGVVERFLGTFNKQVSQRIAGTTFSNISERGDYDAVNSASITLQELSSLIHEWIIQVYIQSPHKGIDEPPIKKWERGLQSVEPLLPASRDQLDLILTREYKRRVNHEGIQIERIKYNSAELRALRISLESDSSVSVRIDPENLGVAWVYDEKEGNYFKVPSIDSYAEGLNLRQHKEVLQDRNKRRVAANQEELLQAKEKLRKKYSDFSKSKSLRQRTKAARLQTPELTSPGDNQVQKEKFQRYNLAGPLPEIPDFDDVWGEG